MGPPNDCHAPPQLPRFYEAGNPVWQIVWQLAMNRKLWGAGAGACAVVARLAAMWACWSPCWLRALRDAGPGTGCPRCFRPRELTLTGSAGPLKCCAL